jgi:uroporphyrinogen decarboxylase
VDVLQAAATSGSPDRAPARHAEAPFVRACRRQPVVHRPVWFMRQAGRALPEYRAVREGTAMLDACRRPDLVVEITEQPVRRFGVDAAILFSDIVVPLVAVGVDLDIVPGVGPVVAQPIRSAAQLDTLRPLDPGDVPWLAEAVGELAERLPVPLIGFAGAPFTLASYLIEGGPSRTHARTKALMHAEPELWHQLLDRLATITLGFLEVQIAAGASAVQLFDSWAGTLSERDYRRFVMPHSARVLAGVAAVSDVPRLHFGVGTGELLGAMGEAGADVVGVDWRVPLDAAARRVGPGRAVQGNLDPTLLLAPYDDAVREAVADMLRRADAAEGHIANLGHGVLPETDPDQLARVVEQVHATPPRPAG